MSRSASASSSGVFTLRTSAGRKGDAHRVERLDGGRERRVRLAPAEVLERGRRVEPEDRLEHPLGGGHDRRGAGAGGLEQGPAGVRRDERHVRRAHEHRPPGALEGVHDAGQRVTRLVGLVPALGPLQLGQLRPGLADHRHALADGRQSGERVGHERTPGEQRPGLGAPPQPPAGAAREDGTGHRTCTPIDILGDTTRRVSIRLTFASLLTVLAVAGPASAAPTTPVSQEGRWIVDADGRVVLMRGVNMVFKVPPYHPGAAGFGIDDARFLAREGFNTVRLGIIYKGVEPSPGVYDEAYLDQIAATAHALAERGHLLPARLPPGHVQRALPGRGLAGLGRLRRRPAARAEERVPGQLLRNARADPRVRQLVGQRRRARAATACRTATRRRGVTWRSASRTSPT